MRPVVSIIVKLVALLLPDHAEHAAVEAQDRLFRSYGLVSSRALPPLVAVGTTAAFERPADLAAALQGYALPPFSLGAPRRINDACAAPLEPKEVTIGLSEQIARCAPAPLTSAAGDLPLPHGALFLSSWEQAELPEYPLGPGALWQRPIRTAVVAIIEIAHAARPRWWQTIAWRITAELKVTATATV